MPGAPPGPGFPGGGPEGMPGGMEQAPAESSGGGIGGFFSSLFGGGEAPPAKEEVRTQTFGEEFAPPPMPKEFQFKPDEHSR